MLQVLNDNEYIKMIIDDPDNDLDVINYLFPHNTIEIDVMGNNLVAIIKEDTTID